VANVQKDFFKRFDSAEAVPTTKALQHPTKPGLFYPVHRRPLRLRGVNYAAPDLICFVTFNVKLGCDVELTGEIGALVWQALRDALAKTGCRLFAACLMPNHVHLFVAPSGTGESISNIVMHVKSWCSTVVRKERQRYLLWQDSFYDHILRESESSEDVFHTIVYYIRTNPQRADLGDDYPFVL
jgi:REP element-mobilizing transposase RayT